MESHDLESLSPLARHRLVRPVNEAIYGVLFPGFHCFFPDHRVITTKLLKSKSSKRQTPTSTIIKCCQLTCFSMYACVKSSGVPVPHTADTSPHTVRGCRQTHTHTHVSVHRPAHLCRTPSPSFAVYCFCPFCSSSVVLLGVGVLLLG